MGPNRAVAGVLLGCGTAQAYTGGPVRAHIFGFDPKDFRVYFHLQAHDEGGYPPEMHYLALDSPDPATSVRAEAFDRRTPSGGLNPNWRDVATRLVSLEAAPDFQLDLAVESDSVGYDADWGATILDLTISATSGDESARLHVQAYCRPLVRIRALYLVPGRPERLVLFSYIGRAYGCEEVDVLTVLTGDQGK